MKISEFINECREYLANAQWMSSSFQGRSVPAELGDGQSMVWLQGQPCDLTNEDVVATVMAWTDWNPNVVSRKELLNAYMGFDYEDRELEMDWLTAMDTSISPQTQYTTKNSMKKYFARLDGDIVGIDHYITFFADSFDDAQSFADEKALENYSEYEDPYDEDGYDRFFATVVEYNSLKHDKYQGDACHTYYEKITIPPPNPVHVEL